LIDFRYHIVSIVAVFLALGLGVVAGTTVLDRVTVDTLRNSVDGLRDRLNEHRQEIRELQAERDTAADLVKGLAPRVTEGLLVGVQALFVTGESEASWHARVREVIEAAGAQNAGSIELTSKWLLDDAKDRDDLVRAFGERPLSERDPRTDAATQLGQFLSDGATIPFTQLVDAGFIRTAPAEGVTSFPPRDVAIVVLGSKDEVPLAALVRGAASVTPTLAASGSVDELGPLATLRRTDDLPSRLATFDSATDDPDGVGIVLSLRAAADGAGGHFGRGSGLRYLPAPP
jgi:hypothetical protein